MVGRKRGSPSSVQTMPTKRGRGTKARGSATKITRTSIQEDDSIDDNHIVSNNNSTDIQDISADGVEEEKNFGDNIKTTCISNIRGKNTRGRKSLTSYDKNGKDECKLEDNIDMSEETENKEDNTAEIDDADDIEYDDIALSDNDDHESIDRKRTKEDMETAGELKKTLPQEEHVEWLTEEDAAFLLTSGGSTKKKLAYVSGATLVIDLNSKNPNENQHGPSAKNCQLKISGTEEQIEKALTYTDLLLQQKSGPVDVSEEIKSRDDVVILYVPRSSVGYITGTRGMSLRDIEADFSTIMFFACGPKKIRDDNGNLIERIDKDADNENATEMLVIIGNSTNCKLGAKFYVMQLVERRFPNYFIKSLEPVLNHEDGFAIDEITLNINDIPYIFGHKSSTKQKLGHASHALLEIVGQKAFIAGSKYERKLCRDYVEWMAQQRNESLELNIDGRDDIDVFPVSNDKINRLIGYKGETVRKIEEKTKTFVFLDPKKAHDEGGEDRRIIICGSVSVNRKLAAKYLDKLKNNQDFHLSERYPSKNYNPPSKRFKQPSDTYKPRYNDYNRPPHKFIAANDRDAPRYPQQYGSHREYSKPFNSFRRDHAHEPVSARRYKDNYYPPSREPYINRYDDPPAPMKYAEKFPSSNNYPRPSRDYNMYSKPEIARDVYPSFRRDRRPDEDVSSRRDPRRHDEHKNEYQFESRRGGESMRGSRGRYASSPRGYPFANHRGFTRGRN